MNRDLIPDAEWTPPPRGTFTAFYNTKLSTSGWNMFHRPGSRSAGAYIAAWYQPFRWTWVQRDAKQFPNVTHDNAAATTTDELYSRDVYRHSTTSGVPVRVDPTWAFSASSRPHTSVTTEIFNLYLGSSSLISTSARRILTACCCRQEEYAYEPRATSGPGTAYRRCITVDFPSRLVLRWLPRWQHRLPFRPPTLPLAPCR